MKLELLSTAANVSVLLLSLLPYFAACCAEENNFNDIKSSFHITTLSQSPFRYLRGVVGNNAADHNSNIDHRKLSSSSMLQTTTNSPLLVCEGDCDYDDDCATGLKCFRRVGFEIVPGCEGFGLSGLDYCFDPFNLPSSAVNLTRVDQHYTPTYGKCMGDCDESSDCNSTLVCFQRSSANEDVPGCEGVGEHSIDYCFNPNDMNDNATILTTISAAQDGAPWPVCYGDCDHDHDCRPGLKCFGRSDLWTVPGCEGDGVHNIDYCFDPNLQPSDKLIYLGSNVDATVDPLLECYGDCDNDSECAEGLKCFKRDALEPVPGCQGDGVHNIDYCFDPTNVPPTGELVLASSYFSPTYEKCYGDCDSHSDCEGSLMCFFRSDFEPVPGCSGIGVDGRDYCYDPNDGPAPTTNPTPAPVSPLPTNSPLPPSQLPSVSPTIQPTNSPTQNPTDEPTASCTPLPVVPWSTYFQNRTLASGDNVTLTDCTTVLLDVSPPPLFYILVRNGASLILPKNKTILLEVNNLHVMNKGRLVGGSFDDPIVGEVTIRLLGSSSDSLFNEERKSMYSADAFLDLHGKRRVPTWAFLAATAYEGDTSLYVKGTVDWQPSEIIAVTSSGFDRHGFEEMLEAEELTIANVNYNGTSDTTRIEVKTALNWTHYGERQCWSTDGFDKHCIDTIAEVALLSRNVVVEGDETSLVSKFGGHIKMHNPDSSTYGRISYVECRYLGQRGLLGKYPIHYHLSRDASHSYAIGNSVHHSYHRAITIHGTDNMLVSKNVAYDIEGHAMYLEDGTETGNTFEENIVFNQREGELTDEDSTPSCYWISNANNTFINNIAAGSLYAGFWFHPEKTADADPSVCPRYAPLGKFVGNIAHSCFKYGIEVSRWLPKVNGQCSDNAPDEHTILWNTTIFKNSYSGVRFVGYGGNGAITLDGLLMSDNGMTYFTSSQIYYDRIQDVAENGTVSVKNGLFVHTSDNEPFNRQPVTSNPVRRAFHLPFNSDNWFFENGVFINYEGPGWIFDPHRNGAPGKCL